MLDVATGATPAGALAPAQDQPGERRMVTDAMTDSNPTHILQAAEHLCLEVTDLCSAGTTATIDGPPLPDWRELFDVLRPERGVDPDAHPVAKCARTLADLHTVARSHPELVGVTGMRLALRGAIDGWTLHHTQYANRCGKSLGSVVDAMAAAQLDAVHALRAPTPAPTEALHAVWRRVGELAVRWADLVDHVVHGQRPVSEGHLDPTTSSNAVIHADR